MIGLQLHSEEATCVNRTVAFLLLPNEANHDILWPGKQKKGLPSHASGNPNTYS